MVISAIPDVIARALLIALGVVLCVTTLVITTGQLPVDRWTAVVMQAESC